MERTTRMNEKKTVSILQRLPLVLAVTAASYGLTLPAGARTADAPLNAKSQQAQPAAQR